MNELDRIGNEVLLIGEIKGDYKVVEFMDRQFWLFELLTTPSYFNFGTGKLRNSNKVLIPKPKEMRGDDLVLLKEGSIITVEGSIEKYPINLLRNPEVDEGYLYFVVCAGCTFKDNSKKETLDELIEKSTKH